MNQNYKEVYQLFMHNMHKKTEKVVEGLRNKHQVKAKQANFQK
jgi:hypothetical protein